jgi:hypothetical protein
VTRWMKGEGRAERSNPVKDDTVTLCVPSD